MLTGLPNARPSAASPPARAGATGVLLSVAAVLVVVLRGAPVDGLWGRPAAIAMTLYAAVGILVLLGLRHHAPRRFGAANIITLVRAAAVAFLAGVAAIEEPPSPALRLAVTIIGFAGLALDGVDGWAARRLRLASRFGARFDMEVDALSMVAITLLLLRSGQAGAWVLAIGMLRYHFVAMGWLWPPLTRRLPDNLRRKSICVAAIVAMLIALSPWVGAPAAAAICAGALAFLVYSFTVDYLWLWHLWRSTPAADRAIPERV
ncbi:MAG: CDP-alcohol phosphatidyltransferase [Rhodospirillales bacterium]|jgi:phosphatidylglycerophosphate synthase|nr:CDP-alcohol phosphatidyltransferase [Rhodospirillales bacterium]